MNHHIHPSVLNVSEAPMLARQYLPPIGLSCLCLLVYALTNFLAFHFLVESIGVFIGLTTMTVSVTTSQLTKNHFIVFIALAFGWCACIDMAHIMAYKEMDLLPLAGGNVSTQLWIMARFLQAMSLLLSFYFLRHSLKLWLVNTVFFIFTLCTLLLIFSHHFPVTYIDNYGVTSFKTASEWGICLILSITLCLLRYHRATIPAHVLFFLTLAIIATIASEVLLSFYISLFGVENIGAHLLKIFSFWFVYVALVIETLRRPFNVLARTASTYDNIPDATMIITEDGLIKQANIAAGEWTQKQPEDLIERSSHVLFHNPEDTLAQCPVCSRLSNRFSFTAEIETSPGRWLECALSPIHSTLFPNSWVHVSREISTRILLENERSQLLFNLGERIKELKCLYALSMISAAREITIPELFSKTVELLPKAFQCPDDTVAKITGHWGEFSSKTVDHLSCHQLKQELRTIDEHSVTIQIFYQPPSSEAPVSPIFLPEEERFLNSVATTLKNALDRICSEDQTKIAEGRLKDSEKHFQAFIEQTAVGVYVSNRQQFLYVNPRFCDMVGRSQQELLSMGLLDLIEDQDIIRRVISEWKNLEREQTSISFQLPLKRKDNVPIILRIDATIISWEGKAEVIGLVQDVTEIQKAKEKIDGYIQQLEQSIKATFIAVSNMVEFRDPYTAGHERRVGMMAKKIGQYLGWSRERCDALELIGLVHDIGKISIPAEILSKPTRLTHLEMELMKTHAQNGYEILKDVPFNAPVAEVIWQHHERLDGSGYPRGLKGDDILPETRIVSVADVIESMSSHRPYRPALGVESALAEIKRGRGTIYDAEVVDAAIHLIQHGEIEL